MNTRTNDKHDTPDTDGRTDAPAVPPSNPALAAAVFSASADAPDASAPPAAETEEDHRKAVNDGRLRKMSEDLKAEREKNAELQRQLEELSKKRSQAAYGDLPEVQKLDDVGQAAVIGAAARVEERVTQRFQAQMDELARSRAAEAAAMQRNAAVKAQNEAYAELERKYPGIVGRLAAGGDLAGTWEAFRREVDDFYGVSRNQILQRANERGHGAAIVRLVEEFMQRGNFSRQYDQPGGTPRTAAAPANPAGAGAGGKKTYPSREAVEKALETIAQQYRKGLIDRKSYDARSEELEDALRSGRYLK